MPSEDVPDFEEADKYSAETYEIVGRLAMSALNGILLDHDFPGVESYVNRAPEEARDVVRQVLENAIIPIASMQRPQLKPMEN